MTGKKIMRTQFVETESRKKAIDECPWQSRILKVCGGYLCFESVDDFETAKNQK